MAACALAAIAILVVGAGALSWGDMGLRRPATDRGSAVLAVAWAAVLAVPTLFLAGLIAIILVGLLGVVPEPVVPLGPDPQVLLVSLVVAGVVAPIWEELFFRGFATTAWARAAGPRAAIVRGAVFFALIHVLTTWAGDLWTGAGIAVIAFSVRLPVGLVLGWVFLRRGTLLAPIALHATYNALPILLYVATSAAVPSA
jgi:membrane protease YdiL (CAAX protease family)